MIIRNDDVNPNSDILKIAQMYQLIHKYIPNVEIYSCVTILGKTSDNGSAYPTIPLDETDIKNVDKVFDLDTLALLENIVSHGLFHLDHQSASTDLQEHSIVASCKLLNTDKFIPPFWLWNWQTEKICRKNKIKLWVREDWKNLENTDFIEGHEFYLFHSWKWTLESLEAKLKTYVVPRT